MRSVAVAAVATVGIVAAGCGSGGGSATGSTLAHGRAIFVHDCASCHTLAGRERGAVGGDLVNAHLDAPDIASFARVMPTPSRLSATAAAAVAAYVEDVARSAKRGR
jgi:mono/diheme cytochrome c family protein